jgi:Dynamin family
MNTVHEAAQLQRPQALGDTRQQLATALNSAIRTLQPSIGRESGLVQRLSGLRERFEDSRLQLAVLGQFKRGKSTFLNALLGAALLPVSVVPLTAIPVFIGWRETPFVRVRFKDRATPDELSALEAGVIRDFLFRYVAEEANPENRLGVTRVDLFYPAPLLADGTVLIDTPGVGSTHRHNTDAALAVLPECDAALFVVSVDPPITEAELDYLRRIKPKVARIFYVLNKIDYLADEERQNVRNFLREVLEKNNLWTSDSEIFCVSARQGLLARRIDNEEEFGASGLSAVETHLVGKLTEEKSDLLEIAMRGKILDGISDGLAEIALRSQALKLPVDELAAKLSLLQSKLRAIEEQRRVTRDILAGEQSVIREEIEAGIASLRKEASSELSQLIEGVTDDARIGQALSAAIERIFDAARVRLFEQYSQRTDAVLATYKERIDADIDTVRRAASEVFQTPFSESRETTAFALRHEPYWLMKDGRAKLLPDPSKWLERLLPETWLAGRVRARMLAGIDELVLRNGENLRWALLRATDETFRDAAAKLQARLDEAVKATLGVIEEALRRRRDASFAIDTELQRLDGADQTLTVLYHRIGHHDAVN